MLRTAYRQLQTIQNTVRSVGTTGEVEKEEKNWCDISKTHSGTPRSNKKCNAFPQAFEVKQAGYKPRKRFSAIEATSERGSVWDVFEEPRVRSSKKEGIQRSRVSQK